MAAAANMMKAGYYTIDEIDQAAKERFPAAYNALIRPSELAWESVNFAGFHERALMIGYIVRESSVHKVLAVMNQDDSSVRFCTRNGAKLSAKDNGRMKMIAPWDCLAEHRPRPQLVMVQTLCQFFFAAAEISEGVWVEKEGWFRSLEVGCRRMMYGLGLE
jgi:hypothetical protein